MEKITSSLLYHYTCSSDPHNNANPNPSTPLSLSLTPTHSLSYLYLLSPSFYLYPSSSGLFFFFFFRKALRISSRRHLVSEFSFINEYFETCSSMLAFMTIAFSI